nr:ubiquitin carboxyl-terminal hydrolase 16 [Quercus suber]
MPERPLTIATYAAGASLAAITLIYVFGPTYFLDDEAAHSSRSSRRKGVVGLVNPANDCFINSVLQALAGLPELRIYLIREMHRRDLDGPDMYSDLTAALEEQSKVDREKRTPEWKILGLQSGQVTAGLKEMVDALNERPIYRKTISAQGFIRVLETSFRTRISRTQQDAQELLQIIAERLADEHRAARRVRRRARRKFGVNAGNPGSLNSRETAADASNRLANEATDIGSGPGQAHTSLAEDMKPKANTSGPGHQDQSDSKDGEDETPFPFEGKLESQVECSHCHFKPKPLPSSFVSLTLHVPQDSTSTTLNACFDSMLKVEHIDDFTCDRCRLEHAINNIAAQLSRSGLSTEEKERLQSDQGKLETALQHDPEIPPKDVKLPELSTAPKRRISRHMRISSFPRILAIHLSRSVWDPYSSSSKNMAKVAFPETLPLGGLLERRSYTLRGVVTHKGGHNSGHYESFRRQALNLPFSTPTSMGTEGVYSLRSTPAQSPRGSAAPSPALKARLSTDISPASAANSPPLSMPPLTDSPSPSSSTSSSSCAEQRKSHASRSDASATPNQKTIDPKIPRRSGSLSQALSLGHSARHRPRAKGQQDRWWRISDEKVKECKTAEVLTMQREVYLLFYEVVEDP